MGKKIEEELLNRKIKEIDLTNIKPHIKNKTILVTGGGGSIGSEICRQVAKCEPKKLIIFDLYENNAYMIQQELFRTTQTLDFEVLIGTVSDSQRMKFIFETYKPDIVFHAAAHKHVPLMEDSPNEAIKNNVLGTYKTAYFAMAYGCEKFVLISTDKAVNPTNIMGASKRLCEMIIQTYNYAIQNEKEDMLPVLFRQSIKIQENRRKTKFCAVRFGNVLESNGSVVPLFRKQIEAGGPVTITDPDIVRYFMTVSEAVNLVLQASVFGNESYIYAIDMGEPIRIKDSAYKMIQQNGLIPEKDIEIKYIGLRKGEKMYEEMPENDINLTVTEHDSIFTGQPAEIDYESFLTKLKTLSDCMYNENADIKNMLKELVPQYDTKNVGYRK